MIKRYLGFSPDNFFKRLGLTRIRTAKRYQGADTGRLYSSWSAANLSEDAELWNSLKTLRARSRELVRNNDYAKKFVRMVKTNIIGENGIILQSRAKTSNNKPDEIARTKIEESWSDWKKKGSCDVTGKYSLTDIENLVVSSLARDGEVLIRTVKGFDNPFGFALQLIEADHLDEHYNDRLPNDNEIKMGVEVNGWGRPIGYWIYPKHPGGMMFGQPYGEKTRINADEIIHLYIPERISQNRGIPWMHSAMARLRVLGQYEEAELFASRMAAAKGGFYTQAEGTGEYVADDEDDGSPIQEMEPGIFEKLPPGWDFKPNDPQHPTTAYKDFTKSIIRAISSGLDVSYNYLANDLEGVNYSSIRAGVLDERDVWRALQGWTIEHFMQPVFEGWIKMAMLSGELNLPFSGYDRWINTRWQGRRWMWVDPLKDVAAKTKEIESGLNAPSRVTAEMGQDYVDLCEQIEIDEKVRERFHVKTNMDLEKIEALIAIEAKE